MQPSENDNRELEPLFLLRPLAHGRAGYRLNVPALATLNLFRRQIKVSNAAVREARSLPLAKYFFLCDLGGNFLKPSRHSFHRDSYPALFSFPFLPFLNLVGSCLPG